MSDDTQPSVSPFAAHEALLRERLHRLLTDLYPLLRIDVIRALEEPGKLLSPSPSPKNSRQPVLPAGVWALLTFLVAQYVAPEIDLTYASGVAVAVECFICALDLLDDVEDDDQTPIIQAIGPARALNASTALLMLAQRAILSSSRQGVTPARLVLLLYALQEAALVATAGQHRDLLSEQQAPQDLTQEECIEIASWKAGALMRLTCRVGALCAHAPKAICEQFSRLGELLGIAHQLDNDSHDLYYLLQYQNRILLPLEAEYIAVSPKTDLVRGKKTLPVVLAARGSLQETRSLTDEGKREEYVRGLYEGILITWGISLLYRERARDHLQIIEAWKPVDPLLRLLLGL